MQFIDQLPPLQLTSTVNVQHGNAGDLLSIGGDRWTPSPPRPRIAVALLFLFHVAGPDRSSEALQLARALLTPLLGRRGGFGARVRIRTSIACPPKAPPRPDRKALPIPLPAGHGALGSPRRVRTPIGWREASSSLRGTIERVHSSRQRLREPAPERVRHAVGNLCNLNGPDTPRHYCTVVYGCCAPRNSTPLDGRTVE